MALGKGLNSLIPQQKTRKKVRKESGPDSERIWHIPLTEITADPGQPRKNFKHKEMEELVASIKKHGHPLTHIANR